MWHCVIFIPDHRLSLYFDSFNLIILGEQSQLMSTISKEKNFI